MTPVAPRKAVLEVPEHLIRDSVRSGARRLSAGDSHVGAAAIVQVEDALEAGEAKHGVIDEKE